MQKIRLTETQHSFLITFILVISCLTMFTINGYVRHREEQREKCLFAQVQPDTLQEASLATYFLKGITLSY